MVYLTNKQGKGQCCCGLFKAIRLLPRTPTAGPISFFRTDCVIIWYKSRRISSWYRMRNYSRDLLTRPRYEISFGRFDRLKLSRRAVKILFRANFKKEKKKERNETIIRSARNTLEIWYSSKQWGCCSAINRLYEFIYFDAILGRHEWCIERDKLAACRCQKCNLRKMNKAPVTIFQRRLIRVRRDRVVGLASSRNFRHANERTRGLFRQEVPTESKQHLLLGKY